MFGYIRPYKPYMRYYEYEIYNAFYCGLCKNLGKNYGQIFRIMLSYDFTFLGLLENAYHSKCSNIQRKHCIVHPFKKKFCLCCNENNNLEYTTASAVISVYHKICDEILDRKLIPSLFFRFIRQLMKKGYKKAKKKLPIVTEKTEYYMKQQSEVEHSKTVSVDCACEPTAQIMSVIAENISDNEEDRRNLAGFGYHLGRFIYLADAYEDIEKDKRSNNYNPLLLNFDNIHDAKQFAMDNINMSLGMASEFYSKLNIQKFREILNNVVYLGLKNFHISKKELVKKRKEIIKI